MLTLEKMIGQLEEAININSDDTVFSDRSRKLSVIKI